MLKDRLNLVIGQINPIVGDIEYNEHKIIDIIKNHKSCDLIIFPEMAIVGYPLMDHIHDPLIKTEITEAIENIKSVDTKSTIILGSFTEPMELKGKAQPFYNSALVIEDNDIKTIINKRLLPSYDVFDERRYFSFDNKYEPVEIKGFKIGILICEDVWDEHYDIKVANNLVKNGAEILIVINASPYHLNKFKLRSDIIKFKAKKLAVPIVYVNMVGGLDEIVYDGQSFITNKLGEIVFKAKAFEEHTANFTLKLDDIKSGDDNLVIEDWRKEIISALKLNLYDYSAKIRMNHL